MMCLSHKYEIIKTTVSEPKGTAGITCSEHMAERLIMGLTTYVFKCTKCGQIKQEECLGVEIKEKI
jgi:hypothetical protein